MRKNQSRRGAAIVEFALVAPLLLIPLVAGVWDISKFIDISQVITRAAREGVVSASRHQDPTDMVKQYVEAAGLNPTKLTIDVVEGTPEPGLGQEVAISLAYDFTGHTIFPWEEFMPGGVSTSARAKME